MQIVDTYLYDGEEEMREARFDALAGLVDGHVAVTANRTHQGESNECPDIDAPFDFYCVDLRDHDHRGRGGAGTPDYSWRERTHRDAAMAACAEGWPDLDEGDIVLVSDVDEIPSAAAIHFVRTFHQHDVLVCQQRFHEYALDWLHPQCWLGTMIARLGPYGRWPLAPQAMRDARGTGRVTELVNGGWHLSWMGGIAACKRKRSRFSHAEHLNVDRYGFAEARRVGLGVNRERLSTVKVDLLDWPPGLLDRAHRHPAYWRLP